MSEFKTNVMRILEKAKIDYAAHEYPHGKDAVDGISVLNTHSGFCPKSLATLVTKGVSGGYFVFVVPVAEELDLKKAAKSVGEKSVEMMHVKDILKVTGYIRGGCSPIGMKKQYPTVFHESCLNNPNIIVSAGKIGYQIDLDPQTLIEFTKGKCADIIK